MINKKCSYTKAQQNHGMRHWVYLVDKVAIYRQVQIWQAGSSENLFRANQIDEQIGNKRQFRENVKTKLWWNVNWHLSSSGGSSLMLICPGDGAVDEIGTA